MKFMTYKPISTLNKASADPSRSMNINKRRSLIKIAVIDDEKLTAKDSLKSYGYDIVELGDIKMISEVADYNIILCDVMGVGLSFNKKAQGAELIKEIKKNYPNIYTLAYTGNLLTNPQAILAKATADSFIAKDADMDEWSEVLDGYVDKALNPMEVWQRARENLVIIGVPTEEILKIESAYVTDFLAKDKNFMRLSKIADKVSNSGLTKQIISSIIAKGIIAMTFA